LVMSGTGPSSTWTATLLTVFLVLIFWKLWKLLTCQGKLRLRSVAVLVLGDIGRSPRMMYHAESFANSGFDVYFVGYKGSKPIPSLAMLPRVQFVYLPHAHNILLLPFVLTAPIKILHQMFSILDAFYRRIPQPPEFIIVQNPPTIPTLALVWLFGLTQGSKIIIDWHNLGYSILAMKLGESHPFVKIAKKFEAYFGRSAYAHLFVTNAMKERLTVEWGLRGEKCVLHDRPPSHFHPSTPSELHELFPRVYRRLGGDPLDLDNFLPKYQAPLSTPFTLVPSTTHVPAAGQPAVEIPTTSYGMPKLREDRPAIIVSSTSWTADEDFSILIEALRLYEVAARSTGGDLPKIMCLITGKGPLQKSYMEQVKKLQAEEKWERVRCDSVWLEPKDYPLLLGSADIGVSLHSSSSALDLPMKVVDMFGCGLPVCALNFACIDELVKDGVNGYVFNHAEELTEQLCLLLNRFPESKRLGRLRQTLQSTTGDEHVRGSSVAWDWGSWEDNWTRVVHPLVSPDSVH
jgi:beta-1,4-mannosyltransferase